MQKSISRGRSVHDQLEGLNQLRLLAALLVFTQHTLSSCQLDELINVAGFRIGRIGTAVFFLLSGFLSASTTRTPGIWFRDRLAVLFPPYWVVTSIGFLMAAVTGTKSFDLWQVVSQLAGTGYFTHGDHIVNIATWFMSPLLMLYTAAALSRLSSIRLMLPVLITLSAGLALQEDPEFSALYCHAVTFFMAFAVAAMTSRGFASTNFRESLPVADQVQESADETSQTDFGPVVTSSAQVAARRMNASLLMAGALLTLSAFNPEFRYGAVASLLLIPALRVKTRLAVCNWFSVVAYEWFLVHGLCLAIVSHLSDHRAVIVSIGAALSVAASVMLKDFVTVLKRRVQSVSRMRATTAPDTATKVAEPVLTPKPILRVDSPGSVPSGVLSKDAISQRVSVSQCSSDHLEYATVPECSAIPLPSCL